MNETTTHSTTEPGQSDVSHLRCEPCQFDHHFDPPQHHLWADAQDLDFAERWNLAITNARCACSCADVDA